ncbi:MAG: hypothetical protein KAS32_15450 [Candidatus Peribacteraceae bacterium]|nr:hypothetical protein [Candidatus Peribacteraceae bacterium]
MAEDNDKVKKGLIQEIGDNRKALHTMIKDIKDFREKMDILLPNKVDFKQKWILQERMKTMTEIIKSELAVRKELNDSVKLESDMRRKDTAENTTTAGDIKALARAVEVYEQEKKSTETSGQSNED